MQTGLNQTKINVHVQMVQDNFGGLHCSSSKIPLAWMVIFAERARSGNLHIFLSCYLDTRIVNLPILLDGQVWWKFNYGGIFS